jgi:hypothetical protein
MFFQPKLNHKFTLKFFNIKFFKMKSFIFIFFWLNSHIRSLEFVPLIQNAPGLIYFTKTKNSF